MTAEEINECGIPIDTTDASAVLAAESALEYVKANTTLDFDINDKDSVKALPSCVKLFALRFCDIMCRAEGITSESLGGMSQSFDTSDKATLLYSLLCGLCGEYTTAGFEAVPRTQRYMYGR